MSFVRCPACRSQISGYVVFCPKCGKEKPKIGWQKSFNFLWNLAIGTFFLVIVTNIYMSVYTP